MSHSTSPGDTITPEGTGGGTTPAIVTIDSANFPGLTLTSANNAAWNRFANLTSTGQDMTLNVDLTMYNSVLQRGFSEVVIDLISPAGVQQSVATAAVNGANGSTNTMNLNRTFHLPVGWEFQIRYSANLFQNPDIWGLNAAAVMQITRIG